MQRNTHTNTKKNNVSDSYLPLRILAFGFSWLDSVLIKDSNFGFSWPSIIQKKQGNVIVILGFS